MPVYSRSQWLIHSRRTAGAITYLRQLSRQIVDQFGKGIAISIRYIGPFAEIHHVIQIRAAGWQATQGSLQNERKSGFSNWYSIVFNHVYIPSPSSTADLVPRDAFLNRAHLQRVTLYSMQFQQFRPGIDSFIYEATKTVINCKTRKRLPLLKGKLNIPFYIYLLSSLQKLLPKKFYVLTLTLCWLTY